MNETPKQALSKKEVALASKAWEALLRAHNTMERQLKDDSAFADVTMREYDVLYSLAKAGKPLTQSALLDAAALSQPAVSRMLVRMERRGLVRRESCTTDGRSVNIVLTPLGTEKQREVGRAHGKRVAELMWHSLSGPQMEQLRVLLLRITDQS